MISYGRHYLPIHQAAEEGDVDEISQILAGDSTLVNAPDAQGATPLHYAVAYNSAEVVRFMLSRGADVHSTFADEPSAHRQSVLHTACIGRTDPDIVSALIAAGADVNACEGDGETPLHAAALTGGLTAAVLDSLLSAGASVDSRSDCGMMPLHSAAWGGQTEAAELLIKAGADTRASANSGRTALHMAAQFGRARLIHLLVRSGADPELADLEGRTPRKIAMEAGNSMAVRIMDHRAKTLEAERNDRSAPDQPNVRSSA